MPDIVNTKTVSAAMLPEYKPLTAGQLNHVLYLGLRRIYRHVSRGQELRLMGKPRGRPSVSVKIYARDFDLRRANQRSLARQPAREQARRARKVRSQIRRYYPSQP